MDNDRCKKFVFFGCNGNRNNFKTEDLCLQACKGKKWEKREKAASEGAGVARYHQSLLDGWEKSDSGKKGGSRRRSGGRDDEDDVGNNNTRNSSAAFGSFDSMSLVKLIPPPLPAVAPAK